jgi:hypothetical protein
MNRRAFLAALAGSAAMTPTSVTAADVAITGHMTNAGQETERYYAIAQGCCLMLDERVWPQAVKLADELLNSDVELTLARRKR